MMNEKKKFYRIRDVAEELDIAISTVHRYIADGLLKAYQIQGRGPWRIKPDEFKRFTNRGK
jgi:excisionase family DNA binding protein